MLVYRVTKWAIIGDEPEPIMDYYRGTDLDRAKRIFAKADAFVLRRTRINPRVAHEAEVIFLTFERYPGQWHSIPARTLEPEDCEGAEMEWSREAAALREDLACDVHGTLAADGVDTGICPGCERLIAKGV